MRFLQSIVHHECPRALCPCPQVQKGQIESDVAFDFFGEWTEFFFLRGQHECIFCHISFYLSPTRAEPMSIKYSVVPTDPLLMMMSPFENACTWSSSNVKCLEYRYNTLRYTNSAAVPYPHTSGALLHDFIIKVIEEPKMPPTRLQELHLLLWENLFLEPHHIFHVLCTSFIKQPKEICPAAWVVLKTKGKNKIECENQKNWKRETQEWGAGPRD